MTTTDTAYLETLLRYFEEEVEGEAYFHGLADHFDEPGARQKLVLLGDVERCAAEAVRPLLTKHGLVPRDDVALAREGKDHIARHADLSWMAFVTHMANHYPSYMDDFEGLEAIAPAEDLPALKILTEHETVAIDFANKELAGDAASTDVLRRYIETYGT